MNKTIYVVSTYYHALISCLKQLKDKTDADILVTEYIPEGESLADRLKESNLFKSVFFLDDIKEFEPRNKLDFLLNQHRKNAMIIERQLPFRFEDYSEINIYHDDIWAAKYLKDKRIGYRLCEDALDSFKEISRSPFAFMLPRGTLKERVKKALRLGYVFCGSDDSTLCVEVNDIDGVELKGKLREKLVEYPRRALFERLTDDDRETLKRIFLKSSVPPQTENSLLLLTQPLFADGVLSSEEEQIRIFSEAVADFLEKGMTLIVKPHPRDTVDYTNVFEGAAILDKNMPIEILAITGNAHFSKVLTYYSTALQSCKAEEYIQIKGRLMK
ncbi:MAG: glycosyltransferase family 52 [Oscillospiraceae bacterium]